MFEIYSRLGSAALLAPNPGVTVGNWIQTNMAGVFVGIVAIIGIVLLIKRQFMQAIVTLFFVGIAAFFVFDPSGFATKLREIVSSFFNVSPFMFR